MTKATRVSVGKVLVINEKGEALVLTIGEYIGRPERSYTPDLPGGTVDSGETSLAAVQRELREETGINIDTSLFNLAYTGTEFFTKENKSVTKFLYTLQLQTTPDVIVSWEHAEYAWVPLDGLLSTIEFRPFYQEAIEYTLSNNLI